MHRLRSYIHKILCFTLWHNTLVVRKFRRTIYLNLHLNLYKYARPFSHDEQRNAERPNTTI